MLLQIHIPHPLQTPPHRIAIMRPKLLVLIVFEFDRIWIGQRQGVFSDDMAIP
jgi:hypothetical protein